VTEAEFSTEAAKAAEKAAGSAANANMMQQVMGFLPIVALLVVGLVLVKSLSSSLKIKNQPGLALAADGTGTLSLPYSPSLEALLGGTSGPASHNAEETEQQLLALTSEGSSPSMDFDDAPEFIGEIKQRIDVPLEQIRKLSKEKPEMVALLLKTWMMEEM
jgi:flagellar biosynthesis/type III secretory pathway M-ring protein FliF/YscJ